MILVISSSYVYAAKKLKLEAKKAHIGMDILSVEDLVKRKFKINISKYQALYIRSPYFINGSPKYFPQIVKLAKQFKKAGKKVVDANIAAGKIGQGKWVDYVALKKAGISIPKTDILSKKTIPKKWPFILKWKYGFKAKNVFYIDNQKKFDEVFEKYPKGELLVQEFVRADYEYKVMTVGYKALPKILRFNTNKIGFGVDFKKFKAVKSVAVAKLAERASKALGRELAKVDIVQKGNRLYILEVNRFPGLDSFEKMTKYNVAKDFVKYLQK